MHVIFWIHFSLVGAATRLHLDVVYLLQKPGGI